MNSGQGIPTLKRFFTPSVLWGLGLLLLTQTSCQNKPQTSIVIVAVDSMSVGDISCAQKPLARSGLSVLCEESVRFTHTYTPSTLSVPAMASLLTGIYPFQHGLHHNGAPGLSSSFQTAAEVAVEKKYRTGFFSGGAPLFRKSGLNQGFEYFEDGFVPSLDQIFKPFNKNIDAFETWLNQEVKSDAFMAYFYASDLNFIETPTTSVTGETRSRTYESQLEELDSQLLRLIKILKRKDQWRETLFIFTSLNGRITNPRLEEFPPLNVHVENTQVPLFIKPPQKIRDSTLHWTVDRNVSLVDVGATLFEILDAVIPASNTNFPTQSLKKSIFTINALPPKDRSILMESGWAQWHKAGGLRAAVVNDQDYIVLDRAPKYYNLLTDGLEINPLPLTTPTAEKAKQALEALGPLGFAPFHLAENMNQKKFSIPYLTWIDPSQTENLKALLLKAFQENGKDEQIQNWLAALAIDTKDWPLLKTLARTSHSAPLMLASTLYQEPNSKTSYKIKDPCWPLLASPNLDNEALKNCPDSLFRDLISWLKTENKDSSKEWLKNRFTKAYQEALIDRKILKTNMALCEVWDVRPDLILRPTYTDLFLNRPENLNLRMSIVRSIPREQEEY